MKIAAVLSLLACAAAAGHEVVTLDSPGQVDYRVARDLDGDGKDELLLVSGRAAWLWRGGDERPRSGPDARLELPEGTALFDLGPPDSPEQALIARSGAAYWALRMDGRRSKLPWPSGPGLPAHPTNVLWRAFFRDFDRDGETDTIDVSLDGYRITFADGSRDLLPPLVTEEAHTAPGAASDRLIARYALADWTAGNFDGDLRPDFAVVTGSGLLLYPGDARGRFDAARVRTVALEEAQDADLSFVDWNRDGHTDALAVRRKAGEAVVLLARPGHGLSDPRRQRLSVPGEMRYPVVTDLDGDGLPDLALPYLPTIGVQDAVRIVMHNEVRIKVPVFLNLGGETCFGSRADSLVTLPVRVRVAADAAGRIRLSGLVVVEYGGDLDGDGRRDLVLSDRTDLLTVRRGVPTTVFHEEVSARIPIPDCAAFDQVRSSPADLNGDGLSDIILHYVGAGRRPDRVHVLWSRKIPAGDGVPGQEGAR